MKLGGSVTNLTDKKWVRVAADLELLGVDGEILAGAPLAYRDVGPGLTRPIFEGVGQAFPQAEYTGIRVLYRAGEVDAVYVLIMLKPKRNRVLVYEDQEAIYSFAISYACIDLKLRNRLGSALRVDWSRAAFVDVLEKTYSVTHGAGLANMVPPYDLLSCSLVPEQEKKGEPVPEVLPRTQDMDAMKGKVISLTLGVEADGEKKEQEFVFQVAEVLYAV